MSAFLKTTYIDQEYHGIVLFRVFVANLPLSPWRVYLLYSPRAYYREKRPRTDVRLSAGQHTNRRLDGQRSILSDGAVCRQ